MVSITSSRAQPWPRSNALIRWAWCQRSAAGRWRCLCSATRLGLSIDRERWLALLAAVPGVQLLPLSPAVAVASTQLPGTFHPDPADRFLVAQARELAIPLVSTDSKIRAYPHLRSLW